METFVKADFDGNGAADTTGIALDQGLYSPTRGIFSGFQAYPEIWELKDGELVWGGINRNCKAALAFLKSLYQKGLIDREFITYTGTDLLKAILNNKCGIIFGGHWLIQTLRKMPAQYPDVEWICPPLPTADGKPVRYPITTNQRGWVAVNSKFKNPEIVYKLFSLNNYVSNGKDPDWWWYERGTQSVNYQIFFTNVSAYDNYNTWLNLMEVYRTGDTSLLRGNAVPHWANLHSELAWEWERMFGNRPHAAMTVLDEAIKRDALFYTGFLGVPSTFMRDSWAAITSEQLVSFTKFITGDVDLETGWDEWVTRFYSMGGGRITADVNEWYKNRK
jgi:putative aldouronate transport system substrate-binding protein